MQISIPCGPPGIQLEPNHQRIDEMVSSQRRVFDFR